MLYGGSNLASAADLRSDEIRVIFFSIRVVKEGANYADREGSAPVIPYRKNSRKSNKKIDNGLYRYRHLVENAFARIKHFLSIATR